jgi:hypothetical protein
VNKMARNSSRKFESCALAPRIPFWDFAKNVLGFESGKHKVKKFSPGQAAIWKSYDRMVAMTEEESDVYATMTGLDPWELKSKPPHNMLLALSRGAGKTMLLSAIAIYEILTNEYEAMIGESVVVTVICPRVKQAKKIIKYAKGLCETSDLVKHSLDSVIDDAIRFVGGRNIIVSAADQEGTAARSDTTLVLLMDEEAFLSPNEDKQIYESASGSGRGVKTFRSILSSSVNGEGNHFHQLFSKYHGERNKLWEIYYGPADVVYPDVLSDPDAETKSVESPDEYRREYFCDFSAGSVREKFFNKNDVKACIMTGVTSIDKISQSAQYIAATDPSGGVEDAFTLTVCERLDDGSVRQCLARAWDPSEEGFTLNDTIDEIASLVAPYSISTIYGDIFGGQFVSEAFAAVGLDYQVKGFNNVNKLQRASCLRHLFHDKKIMILDDDKQYREIKEYESKRLPSGAISVNHPDKGSDDMLDALALATWELVGHDVKLHPPEQLQVYNEKNHYKMYTNNKYPQVIGRGPVLSDDEIMAGGEGPKWMVNNWSKNWRTALLSIGEIAHTCGIGPFPTMNMLGRETVLQHAWMRWVLGYWGREIHFKNGDISELTKYPLCFSRIKAWPEIIRQINMIGFENVITYQCLGIEGQDPYSIPDEWQTWKVEATNPVLGIAEQAARPPWTRPMKEWGINELIQKDSGKPYAYWPDRPWADCVEFNFIRGEKERKKKYSRNETTIIERYW